MAQDGYLPSPSPRSASCSKTAASPVRSKAAGTPCVADDVAFGVAEGVVHVAINAPSVALGAGSADSEVPSAPDLPGAFQTGGGLGGDGFETAGAFDAVTGAAVDGSIVEAAGELLGDLVGGLLS